MNEFEKFMTIVLNEADKHRTIAKKFTLEDKGIDHLNDTKYHSGMADMAEKLWIEFQVVFREELNNKKGKETLQSASIP